MANGGDGKGEQAGGGIPSAFDAFLAELDAFAPEDAARIKDVESNVAKGGVEADPSWFVRYLTEKQIRYGLYYAESAGDFKTARVKAGYKQNARQDQIEEGPAMRAYMIAVKNLVAQKALVSAELVLGRLNRIALKAEERGQLDSAIRANVKLGEAQGMFVKAAPTIHVNADGAVINIGVARSESEDEDEAIEATWREIAETNGHMALPQDGEA